MGFFILMFFLCLSTISILPFLQAIIIWKKKRIYLEEKNVKFKTILKANYISNIRTVILFTVASLCGLFFFIYSYLIPILLVLDTYITCDEKKYQKLEVNADKMWCITLISKIPLVIFLIIITNQILAPRVYR